MGKKNKIGKARKDKFYHLAKETGFRSRAAFKLLQLNSKYEFLQTSRVCVDLCAAPGGWMQVAVQQMPVSSLIIGIDLVPIKPIHGATSFQGDITTEKCRQELKKELQTWDADVFLNDGAPNVGQNWVFDAFKQAELTLAALKLATEFLKKGGWFVTKVFRSKDYHALMWVFKQLFKKVYATKPQASRNESAEIFVVCQYYIKPDKLDPKFVDPKYVFQDVEKEEKKALNVLYPHKEKKRAVGYGDEDTILHHKLKVSDFISSVNHVELLGGANEIELDVPEVGQHPLTTPEIKECLRDIKLLGKRDINAILNWRKKMVKFLEKAKKEKDKEEEGSEEEMEMEEVASEVEEESEEKKLEEKIAELEEEEIKANKRKRKKVMKEKRKLRDKMSLNMIIPGDTIEMTDDIDLFDIKKLKSKHHLEQVEQEEMSDAESESDSDLDEPTKMVKYSRVDEDDDGSDDSDQDDDEEEDDDSNDEVDDSGDDEPQNPLVVDLETKDVKAKRKMDMWFSKDVFSNITEEDDVDLEIDQVTREYVNKGGTVLGQDKKKKTQKKKQQQQHAQDADSGNASDEDAAVDSDDLRDSDSDSDSDEDTVTQKPHTLSTKSQVAKDGFEIVSQSKPVKLDPLELAIGEELIKSGKRRREIIEMSYNRYTNNDDNLPDWFMKDEQKHRRKQVPVSKEQIETYKEKHKDINIRTIKKVAEAKARKKRKAMKKLEKARKKSEAITDAVDVTEKEKWHKIKQIYKKAGVIGKKKPEVTYVVAKKGTGKRVSRPAGVKGRFKVVDPRMKKDMRSMMKGKGSQGREKKRGKPDRKSR